MTHFRVDPTALDSAATHIGATIDRITADVASMNGHLRSLDGAWAGPAALAFADLMTEWEVASGRLTESLATIASALRAVQAHYIETEASNVRLFGR